ncbi:GWxTD domain-containing protein [candidate division KSB1 bacterium]
MLRHTCYVFVLFIASFMIIFTSGNIHAQTAQECYEQGLALKEAGDIDGAIEMFDEARKKDRNFAEANYELALCYMTKDYPTARMLAEYAIDRALNTEPENCTFLYTLALIKDMQNFKLESMKILDRTLDIDPDYHDARFMLAELLTEKGWDQNLEKAKIHLNELNKRVPGYKDLYYLLGKVYYENEEYKQSELHLKKQLENEPTDTRAKLLIGKTFYRLDKLVDATNTYLDGLSKTSDPEIIDKVLLDIQWLFNDAEKREYNTLSFREKGMYLARYWRKKDTDIITEENERLIEHFRRVDYVKDKYHESNYRGYDDRGEIYLKYGEPDAKYINVVASRESWLYWRINEHLAYDFAISMNQYKIVPLTRHIDKMHLGGIYAEMMSYGGEFALTEGQAMADKAIAESPPERYVKVFEETPINFHWSYAQFRGENEQTEIDLSLGLPHDQFDFTPGLNGFSANVETEVVLLDSTFIRQSDIRHSHAIKAPVVDSTKVLLSMETIELQPGEYRFGIQAKQENANKLGIYQPEITVRDFSGSELLISDILISSEPVHRTISVVNSRNELDLQPYPFPFVQKEQPLVLYFEIYNLMLDPGNRTSYDLTYTIEPAQPDIPRVESFLKKVGRFLTGQKYGQISIKEQRTGTGRTAHELVHVDISDIPEMDALITITVRDKISGQTAESTREIRIIK